jgi:hypothetical protein
MNTKTSVNQLRTTTPATGTFRDWLARAGQAIAVLGPRDRGLVMLVALLLVAVPVVKNLFPTRVTPASAPAAVFSAERAMVDLEVIAKEPHPRGSPALAEVRAYLVQELSAAGLEVEVQEFGSLRNVLARLHGSDPSGAIVILAHYDTVSTTRGAGDNSSTVAALLEIMRTLAAGPVPRNDIIALFDDGEEGPDTFAGTKAFVVKHPWMSDVRLAISIDSAVAGFISTNEVGPQDNGWLVEALDEAYTGGSWMSFSGGGVYNSTPFINAGIPVITLEDGYPFRQKHTAEDTPDIIHPGSVQQLGDQTVSVARVLGERDLNNPGSEQHTFFSLPLFGFFHYPQAWALPLGIAAAALLLVALGLGLWKGLITWRGLGVSLAAILLSAAVAFLLVNVIKPELPGWFGWQTTRWHEWPEVIPPNGWLVVTFIDLLVLALASGLYMLARRWSGRADFALTGLLPFAAMAVVLGAAEPRTAYAPTWPVLVAAIVWIAVPLVKKLQAGWAKDLAVFLAALLTVMIFLPFVPGIVMADGMKSLEIIAAIEALLLASLLPVVDGLLVWKV